MFVQQLLYIEQLYIYSPLLHFMYTGQYTASHRLLTVEVYNYYIAIQPFVYSYSIVGIFTSAIQILNFEQPYSYSKVTIQLLKSYYTVTLQ